MQENVKLLTQIMAISGPVLYLLGPLMESGCY